MKIEPQTVGNIIETLIRFIFLSITIYLINILDIPFHITFITSLKCSLLVNLFILACQTKVITRKQEQDNK